jgi:hypothetical protein
MAKQTKDVESVREQITAVVAELDAIARAPIPLAEATEHMGTLLDAAAARYLPSVEVFARDPDPQLDVLSVLLPDPRWDAPAVWAFWAAVVDRPSLVAFWAERLRQAYASDPTLANPVPLAERAGRLEDLRRRLHELEVQEELAITAGERRGEVIDRREDADPRIVFAAEVLAEATP